MYPNPTGRTSFKFPSDRLTKLKGQVPERELYNLPMLDRDNEPCLMVYKSGAKTGVTLGRASGSNVCSYTHNYFEGHYTTSGE